MRKLIIVGFAGMLASLVIGCGDHAPMYGRAENYDRSHLQFGDADLEGSTRVDPVEAVRDPAGLLHVTLNIRSTISKQQYVDAYITFLRDGQKLEKLGPKTVTLKGNLPDTLSFNSTQPATDYYISLDYAK